MICVDDFTRFKLVSFLKKKSDTAGALKDVIADYIKPAGLDIGAIRTDEGGEFEGEFQRLLIELSIKHEHTHPDTPQYNGVAERALGLLREKTIAMMQGFSVGADDKLWAEAMSFACDMTNMSATTSLEKGVSPYEMWYGRKPVLQHLQPFGTVGYMRQPKRAHKLEPCGVQCIMVGIADNHPSDTVRVRDLETGKFVNRQGVRWHPEPVESGKPAKRQQAPSDLPAASGGGGCQRN